LPRLDWFLSVLTDSHRLVSVRNGEQRSCVAAPCSPQAMIA
jgi:hypothetical protein